jgi:hypothetical protein
MGEWHEEMTGAFGVNFRSSPWGEAERKLCRALLKEETFERALQMVRHFIRTWEERGRGGTPGFRLFWAMRDSVRAEVRGQVKVVSQVSRRRIDLNHDEWDADAERDSPAVGW